MRSQVRELPPAGTSTHGAQAIQQDAWEESGDSWPHNLSLNLLTTIQDGAAARSMAGSDCRIRRNAADSAMGKTNVRNDGEAVCPLSRAGGTPNTCLDNRAT